MRECDDYYPSIFVQNKFNFKVVDIDIDDGQCEKFNSSYFQSEDSDTGCNETDENDETDLDEEIRRSKFGCSGHVFNNCVKC